MDAPTLRTGLVPGDLGWIVARHGELYAQEYGFDPRFEAYVAGPLGEHARALSPRERIWIAEQGGRRVGCIAIVAESDTIALLRWFLVEPDARGAGLGARLFAEALAFARAQGYPRLALWTVSPLTTAARLYAGAGFVRVWSERGRPWGVDLVQERHELALEPAEPA